jgi:hypothetical protein
MLDQLFTEQIFIIQIFDLQDILGKQKLAKFIISLYKTGSQVTFNKWFQLYKLVYILNWLFCTDVTNCELWLGGLELSK